MLRPRELTVVGVFANVTVLLLEVLEVPAVPGVPDDGRVFPGL